MKSTIVKQLKSKKADSISALIVIFAVIMTCLFIIQICSLFTSAYTLRQRCNHTLAQLEASITEDVYEYLTESNFDLYKEQIIVPGTSNLQSEYKTLFFKLLKENLNFSEVDNKYVGNFYSIDADSVDISTEVNGNKSIRLTLTFTVDYEANIPFADEKFTLFDQNMVIVSDYAFHGGMESENKTVTGEGNVYDHSGV